MRSAATSTAAGSGTRSTTRSARPRSRSRSPCRPGYGLAIGRFPGRKLILSLTLVVMIVPGAALVLPIFLELDAVHLIGSVLSVILPFSFFPFGVYLAYLYYATALPPAPVAFQYGAW